ncbi:aldo/keto reductase [Ktedonospora formicarum]|uniref:Oxidoreductase n=1 Tax=Ktedonospora formicarum TaxID=2778364 RepID=A0A8J3I8P3_9CHLR|nr:aldo/keto reductase [Ktedonospora formicarum]GHO47838.1 oxidoreductase [Ktedonospora formicarum]
MQYTTLGKTGLVVSRLMLGTMTFGEGTSYGFDHPVNQERANNMVSQALEAGINFFDTANNYGEGRAEEYLGRALGSQRSNVIIATKLGARTGPALTDAGLSYRHVIASTEASLKRLGTDYIDLLQLHVPDPLTPFEETARALDHLIQRGLVRYVGYSNLNDWQAATFLATQRQHGYAPFVSAQMYYSLLGRDIEYGVVPFLRYEGLGLLVWSPLAGGFLSGKYSRELTSESSGRLASFDYLSILSIDREKGYTVIERLREIAAAHGEATPAQIALAWLLTKPVISSVILGASTPEQFADNINASNLCLSPEEVASLDSLTEPKPLYPYRWRASGGDSVVRQALNIS